MKELKIYKMLAYTDETLVHEGYCSANFMEGILVLPQFTMTYKSKELKFKGQFINLLDKQNPDVQKIKRHDKYQNVTFKITLKTEGYEDVYNDFIGITETIKKEYSFEFEIELSQYQDLMKYRCLNGYYPEDSIEYQNFLKYNK